MKVMVLGHKGMLGNCVSKYFLSKKVRVVGTDYRWSSEKFKLFIILNQPAFVINCIGLIPQKETSREEYFTLNTELPAWLTDYCDKLVVPTTDGEFSGNLKAGNCYRSFDKRDAEDEYGLSKIRMVDAIVNTPNTYLIRTSIIGIDSSKKSLLSWFLDQKNSVNGYNNHYWNGITSLEWAKIAYKIFCDQLTSHFNQVGSSTISKYNLLNAMKLSFDKPIEINKVEHPQSINRCLVSDFDVPPIYDQLSELKDFYKI